VAVLPRPALHGVLEVRSLSPSAYILRLERGNLEFRPGQHVRLGVPGLPALREYTVYSAPDEPYLEVLIREMAGGLLSPRLRRCRPGDPVELDGPFGEFLIPEHARDARFLFVATGTGIAPFHSFARSYPRLDYRLLHGVAAAGDLYGSEAFAPHRSIPCLSRERGAGFSGRVTAFLRRHPAEPDRHCYLCGGCDMIYEVFALLRRQGVPPERIFAEVYY
jgi:ferredoxin--NADP+ reductase